MESTLSPPQATRADGRPNCLSTGSTANIWQHSTHSDVIIKIPKGDNCSSAIQNNFATEAGILKALGPHPRIVKYLGLHEPPHPSKGLVLAQAANGDLRHYLEAHNSTIGLPLRVKWCKQLTEGLAHCHRYNVWHCDLRPDNMLLDANLDLWLSDFGGSGNKEYNGHGLPNYGFFDPREDSFDVTEATEVFGLGSCLYNIMTGSLPHGSSAVTSRVTDYQYIEEFKRLVGQGEFPDVSGLVGGNIIMGCWTGKFQAVEEVYERYLGVGEESGSG